MANVNGREYQHAHIEITGTTINNGEPLTLAKLKEIDYRPFSEVKRHIDAVSRQISIAIMGRALTDKGFARYVRKQRRKRRDRRLHGRFGRIPCTVKL